MGLGGPVWHVSVASRGLPYGRGPLEQHAERELVGVGDPHLGEWREWGDIALHIRRRLTPAEQAAVGDVQDIRRTPEAVRRAQRLGRMLTLAPPDVLVDEIGK